MQLQQKQHKRARQNVLPSLLLLGAKLVLDGLYLIEIPKNRMCLFEQTHPINIQYLIKSAVTTFLALGALCEARKQAKSAR